MTIILTLLLPAAIANANPADVQRVSVASDGTAANESSNYPSLSDDGRYVAFESYANNLVPGDTNNAADIFVFDRMMQTIERVSVNAAGEQANRGAHFPTISNDGRYVAFHSDSDNLVADDTNKFPDIFLFDRVTRQMKRIAPAYDEFESNGYSYFPTISADGRYVAFHSSASNLIANDTNNLIDIFLYDNMIGSIRRVSMASDGTQGNGFSNAPSISHDGRYIAFHSDSSNLVPGDTNNLIDVFVYDQQTSTIERISMAYDDTQANSASVVPGLSFDGRYVTFESDANNLVPGDTNGESDIFVHDRNTGITERVSLASNGTQANGTSYLGYNDTLSADGRYVIFQSIANNLVPGDTNGVPDVFIYDRDTNTIERISESRDGMQANGGSSLPSISADGRYVAFQTQATNLIAGDTNNLRDIYVATRRIVTPSRLYPYDGQVVSNQPDWPQFSFQPLADVEWYGVWIGSEGGSQTFLYEWYPANEICGDVCVIPVDLWLSDGVYEWWLTYYGPEQPDYEGYWNNTTFVVDFAEPMVGFSLNTPVNGATLTTGPATLTWARDPNVLWYNLWVGPADYSTWQISAWVDATQFCNATTCTIDTSALAFPVGGYEVWVELWGPGAYLTWNSVNQGSPAATFTVGTPAPAAPIPIDTNDIMPVTSPSRGE